jgi:hypothetical protein
MAYRGWMAAGVLLAGVTASPETFAQTAATPQESTARLVRQLASDEHHTREKALAELAIAGAPSVPALIAAAVAKDPELSWRATEGLEVLCQTVDLKGEKAVKSALVKFSRSEDKAQAAVAKKVLQQWPVLRHHYAAAQLESLGAEIVDYPIEQTVETQTVEGVMPIGGFFGMLPGAMPRMEDPLMIEDFDVGLAGFGAVAFMEADVDEAAEEAEAEPAEDPAPAPPPPARAPLLERIFGALRRVAEPARAPDAPIVEPLHEHLEVMEEEAVPDAPAGPADVEFIEDAPAAGPVMIDGIEMIEEFAMPAMEGMIEAWDATEGATPAGGDEMQPGTLRIGKEWRGGDGGLEYVAQLQQIHTVILREAPLTDAALAQLQKLTSLTQLRVIDTRISSAALMRFHQQRPGVTITAVGPAALGVTGADHPQGLLVQQVIPETGARRAGIDEQDIITKVDGLKVRGLSDVVLALYDKTPGRNVKIDYLRGGKARSVEVALTARDEMPSPTATGETAVPQQHFGGFIHRFLPGRVMFGGGFPVMPAPAEALPE